MTKMETLVEGFAQENPGVLERLRIDDLSDLDPAAAATFALEMTARKLRYANDFSHQNASCLKYAS